MPPVFPVFFAFLAFSTITEQYNMSLKELEEILKNLAAQTAPKTRAKSFQYLPHYPRLELQQKRRNRKQNIAKQGAQSPKYLNQLNNMRSLKQLEDDLQQALTYESYRICQSTGRCGCFGGRCGKPNSAVYRTVDEMEQLLEEVNKDLNKQSNKKIRSNRGMRQKYGHQRQPYEDRKQQQGNRIQTQDYDDSRQRQDNTIQEYDEDRRQRQNDWRYEYKDKGQRQDDIKQEYQDRRQRHYDDKRQEYEIQKQEYDDNYEDDINQDLKITTKNNDNPDFDIIILDVPESSEFQDKDNDVKIVDIRASGIKNLLQKQRELYDNNNKETEQRVDNMNLDDFVKYYEKIKKEITNSLLKYVKGLGDGPYLKQLLPYQKKQIEYLKRVQSKKPWAGDDLKVKIVQLLLGNLSNIKLLPHSRDGQTIFIPQRVHNAIPIYNRDDALRSNKRLFPLTLYQKQRQRNLAPRNIILKHSWRRNDQQIPNYGVPFDLQVQGLGQIN